MPFLDVLPVRDGLSERIIEEAALVDEWDRHEGAEAGHALVMHARLPDHLRYIYVLEALKDAKVLHFFLTSLVDNLLLSFLAGIVRTKDVMGDTDARLENCTLDELVILQLDFLVLACVDEFNDLVGLHVQMSLIVVIDFDLALRILKPADVDTSSTCVLLQEVDESGQVVRQVFRRLQLLEEVCLVFFFLLRGLDLLLRTSLIEGYALLIASFLVSDDFKLGYPLNIA